MVAILQCVRGRVGMCEGDLAEHKVVVMAQGTPRAVSLSSPPQGMVKWGGSCPKGGGRMVVWYGSSM